MKKITLYHGSKSGLTGEIKPSSREFCDYGKGFYMGTEKKQPLTLICNYPDAKLYTLELDLTGLKTLSLYIGLEWALIIAFHRGKMENFKGTGIYEKYSRIFSGYDVIDGYIANDRMFVVLDRFFNGDITDKALISSLSALKLGKQYVAVTELACKSIKIIEEAAVSEKERKTLITVSEKNRQKGIALADKICRDHRRDGLFFDEILQEAGAL